MWQCSEGAAERFCLGLLSCRWPGKATPAQQAGFRTQIIRGWVPRTDHANCLNPPEENAWALWERAVHSGQTSNVVNPVLNSSLEAHRTSPPCFCHSVLSCFPGQCCSTSSQLLGHLHGEHPAVPGHHHAAQQPLAATGSRAYPDPGQHLAFATSQRNRRPRHGKRNSSSFQLPLEHRYHFPVWDWNSRPWFRQQDEIIMSSQLKQENHCHWRWEGAFPVSVKPTWERRSTLTLHWGEECSHCSFEALG